MAVPDQQFQDIIDNIEKSVTDTISTVLRTQSPVALDLDEFREQILDEVRNELHVFKEQLLTGLEEFFTKQKPLVEPQQSNSLSNKLKQWW